LKQIGLWCDFLGTGYSRAHLEPTIWSESLYDAHQGIFRFALVTDLDQMSLSRDARKPTWISKLKLGKLHQTGKIFSVEFDEGEIILETHLGEAGRGLELSELVSWQGRLWTFDDRSGVAFEIIRDKIPTNENNNADVKYNYRCVPRYILTEGDGIESAKGQKTEWATVKDGKLYVGSFGKEFVKNGHVTSRWNMWINVIDENGKITHEDWTDKYNLLREATGASYPGYMVHEAIHWDPHTRQWYVLPRRVSSEPYDEKLDEKRGSNMLLIVDENWKFVKVVRVGDIIPERGYSSFKFVPGSTGTIIAALKSEEDEDKQTGQATQATYFTVFDLKGNELLPQTQIPGRHKYEGIEFL